MRSIDAERARVGGLEKRKYGGRCHISEVCRLNIVGQTQRVIVGIDNMVRSYGIGSR
jgi:hypothetical protein